MRLIHIINSLNTGGAEKLLLETLPIYKSNLEVVDVAILSDSNRKSIFMEEISNRFNGNIFILSKGSVYNPFLIFKLIGVLKNYDIVHVHLFPALYWVVFAKLFSLSKIKIVYTEHNTNNRRRNIIAFKYLDRFIYSFLDFVGCISLGTKENLTNHLGNSNVSIKLISNGINLNLFSNKDQVNKTYNYFSKSDFILIQVSSFREQKDQETLIKSLLHLPNNIKLLLVGDGKLRSEKESLVENLGLTNRVLFLGNRKDIPELLHYSDVCILSSFYEGFGLSIVEGMASGKPSIASNVPGIREVLLGHGLLFEPQNDKQLSEHIYKLFTDQKFYDKIARQCLERSKHYDIMNMVNEYIEVYKKLLNCPS